MAYFSYLSVVGIIMILWYICAIIQLILSYGTAYRLTKRGGDNGVALFGWILVMGMASFIPGLGFYLWSKYRDKSYYGQNTYGYPYPQSSGRQQFIQNPHYTGFVTKCSNCGNEYYGAPQCPVCGYRN